MPNAVRALRAFVLLLVVALLGAGAGPKAASAADPAPATKTAPAKKAAAKKPVSAAEAVKETVEGEDVRDFRTFCDTWMQKLRDRNTYNSAHIPWTKGGPGVVGEYVSYNTERTCIAKRSPARIRSARSPTARSSTGRKGRPRRRRWPAAGTIVEQTDVTEIFRYGKGRWQY
jgi:hypothetical protein